jgi:hypothetical protein
MRMKILKRGTDQKNNILSLYENENLKKGDGQKNKRTCPPCMRMKISKRGTDKKKPKNKHLIPVRK